MVLCLVTLTDLQTRRAGLSASAELLVSSVPSYNYRVGQRSAQLRNPSSSVMLFIN